MNARTVSHIVCPCEIGPERRNKERYVRILEVLTQKIWKLISVVVQPKPVCSGMFLTRIGIGWQPQALLGLRVRAVSFEGEERLALLSQ